MKNQHSSIHAKRIIESLYKLERKIASTVLTCKLEKDTHVPDLMTKIRILKGVAVVGQKAKVERYMDGDDLLTISIKFLPNSDEIYSNLEMLSKMIRRLPGVKSITAQMYNKKVVTLKGKKIIF